MADDEDDRSTRARNLRALGLALSLVGLAWVLFGIAVWMTETQDDEAADAP